MNRDRFIRYVKLFLPCILAVGGNLLLGNFCVYFMKFPLFLDTVFNIAVTFAVGLIPGLVTVLLSYLVIAVRNNSFSPFILCSIAEVIIVYRLKPAEPKKKQAGEYLIRSAPPEMKIYFLVGVFAKLMVLYIACSLAISVLGGMIDFLFYGIWSNPKLYYSAEDAFKIGLLRSGIPLLAMDILSRIPVNIVYRFIVIFGGYFVSRLIVKLDKWPFVFVR
jgi:energy-coupling factor transport system substrate-specific component